MLISLLFFLACFICGWALTRALKFDLSPVVEIPIAMVLGTAGMTLVLFFLAWVIPFSEVSVVVEMSVLVGVAVWKIIRDRSLRLPKSLKSLRETFGGTTLRERLLAGLLVILVVWLFGRALFYDAKGQLWAGDRLVWTDWPLHMAMAANFAWGGNFPPQNPTFAGTHLIYPFFADFLSGVLLRLGTSIPAAFAVPGVVLTLTFFGIYLGVVNKLLRSPRLLMSFGALFLSLFWGGLGWVYWLAEAFANEATLVETLLIPPREYTFWAEKGLWFFTFLYSEILPQRAFIFGLPLFFLVVLLFMMGWEGLEGERPAFAKASAGKRNRGIRLIIISGLIGGLMPFFHTHSYIALVILVITMGIIGGIGVIGRYGSDKKYRKKYLEACFLFFLPFGTLSLLQLPLFIPQTNGLPFHFGWMKEQENFFVFWFKNTGLFIPLYVLGLCLAKRDPASQEKFWGFEKVLGVAAWSLFIMPNLFQFAPWGYDNLKIFTYWYLIGSVFVVDALRRIWRINRIGRIGAIVLFVSLTLSGVIEVGRLLDTNRVKVGLWPKEDYEFAQEIRRITPTDAVFLTAAIHDHPVTSLAGRKILLGFPGNSWSWGIKGWDERERDVHMMFRGGEEAKSLWQKYGIDYIVVSDRERYFEKELDEEYIAQNGEVVLEKGNTRVYRIND